MIRKFYDGEATDIGGGETIAPITGEELGALLFGIHTHVGSFTKGDLDTKVYREDDLIRLLKAIGLPEPVWGRVMSIEQYLKNER